MPSMYVNAPWGDQNNSRKITPRGELRGTGAQKAKEGLPRGVLNIFVRAQLCPVVF